MRSTLALLPVSAMASALASACLAAPPAVADLPSPEQHLGRPLGRDFELADWDEVRTWFERLGAESPRTVVETVGQTTEGRDFVLAVLSSEDNLARLDELKEHARVLADPRGATDERKAAAVRDGKVFLFVSCAMHATEVAAPQFAMELAWNLATSDEEPWRSAREDCVVLLAPSLNPDGQDHVVSWYRETVGTPYEAAGLLKLYQYYAGHDNNRDWFMLTQAETRIVTELLYSVWRPQVYWDVHQQGTRRERFFVPPFRDPLNPNLDSGIIAGITTLGTRAQFDMTRAGFDGVSTGVSYDMWWNGGNRNVPVRHNIVGLLTEAASARLATPVFLERSDLRSPVGGDYRPSNQFPSPWPGGWWRLRDILDYELAFARSLLGSLTRERETWLANALEAAGRSIEADREGVPRAWLVPSDNTDVAAVRRLLEALRLAGVELHVADESLDADGRTYPAGTVVIQRGQPYGQHVKDLFEVQRYPQGDPPYDVAGWTLPLLMGVRRVEVVEPLDAPLREVGNLEEALAGFGSSADGAAGSIADGAAGSAADGDAWRDVIAGLAAGKRYGFVGADPDGDPDRPPLGTFVAGAAVDAAADLVLDRLPRIGVYSPWRGNMDEGWLRWVLDTWGLPYVTVRNEMLRAGDLGAFLDVLILPGNGARELDQGRRPGSVPEPFAGGLAPEGAVAVEEFVRGGGALVAIEDSAAWAIELLRLPLVDVTREAEPGEFACPGSVLRSVPEAELQTAGLPPSIALFFSRALGWRDMTEKEREDAGLSSWEGESLLRYAPTRLLLSGYLVGPELLADRAAWVRARHGEGHAHLFGFRPQYRGWSQASFYLLFRAILLEEYGR